MWTMSDYRGRARQAAISQRINQAVNVDIHPPAVHDALDVSGGEAQQPFRAGHKPIRMTTVNPAPNIPREAAAFEVCRRTHGKSRPLIDVPTHLLERVRDFPALDGFSDYTPLGQANILILQLADRLHALEERVDFLENERLSKQPSDDKHGTGGVKREGGHPTPE